MVFESLRKQCSRRAQFVGANSPRGCFHHELHCGRRSQTGAAMVQQSVAGEELGAESSDRKTARPPPGVHSPAPANLVGFLDGGASLPGHGFYGPFPVKTAGILPTPNPETNPHAAGIVSAGEPTQTIQSRQQSWSSAVVGLSYKRPDLQVNRSPRNRPHSSGLPRQALRPQTRVALLCQIAQAACMWVFAMVDGLSTNSGRTSRFRPQIISCRTTALVKIGNLGKLRSVSYLASSTSLIH